MEVSKDFKFRDDMFDSKDANSTVPIELTVDPFNGIIYRYTTVRFKLGEDDIPRLQYDYEIIKTNDLSMITLRKNKKFNEVLGLILNSMLLDLGDAEANENGNNNSEESDSETGLYSESAAIP